MMDVRISYNKNAGKLVNKSNIGTSKLLKLSSASIADSPLNLWLSLLTI